MPARINHNTHLKQVARHLNVHNTNVARQIEQLSSGKRLNRSSDDPASLALSEGITAEIRAIAEGSRNIQQTFALLQIADGSLSEISAMVRRMTTLSLEAGSSVVNDDDRLSINSEFTKLIDEIDRVAGNTSYNGKTLLTGFIGRVTQNSTAVQDADQTGVARVRLTDTEPSTFTFVDEPEDGFLSLGNGVVTQTVPVATFADGTIAAPGTESLVRFREIGVEVTLAGEGNAGIGVYRDGNLNGKTIEVEGITRLSFQVGPSGTSNDVSTLSIADMRASGPELNLGDLSIITPQDALKSLDRLRQALDTVIAERSRIGAFQNRLELSAEASETIVERMQATASEIRDADVARAVTEMSKSQIMSQVAASMAVEADTDIERILSLLR